MRGSAVAVVAAAALTAGCAMAVEDPRGVQPDEAAALERAAHTRDPEDEGGVADPGGVERDDDPVHDGFDLLRPAEEAAAHPLSTLWGPDAFGIHDGGEIVFEWANRDELWDQIAVPAGEACRRSGPPIEEPLFDDPDPLEAAVDPYWNNRSTSGRGTLVSVMCAYVDGDRGPVERYEAHLVATDPETGEGRVVASGGPWELVADAYDDVSGLVRDRDTTMAEWARQQGEVDADPIRPAPDYGLDAATSAGTDAEQR